MIDVDVSRMYKDVICHLQKNPPSIRYTKGLKRFTSSDNKVFKGRHLVDWLSDFLEHLEEETEKVDPAVQYSPEHAFKLASALLETGAIKPKSKEIKARASLSSISSAESSDLLFSLREKYIVDKENISIASQEIESHWIGSDPEEIISGDESNETQILEDLHSGSSSSSTGNLTHQSSLKKGSLLNIPKFRRASLPSLHSLDFLKEKSCSLFNGCESLRQRLSEFELPPIYQELGRQANEYARPRALKVGDKCSDFQLPDQKGKLRSLSTYLKRGPVLVNFMLGGDCEVCCKDLEYFAEVEDYLALANCKVLNISPETKTALSKTAKRLNLDTTYLSDLGMNVTKDFGASFPLEATSEETLTFLKVVAQPCAKSYGYGNEVLPPAFPVRSTFIVDVDLTIKYTFIDFVVRAEPASMVTVLKEMKAKQDAEKMNSSSSSFIKKLSSSSLRKRSSRNDSDTTADTKHVSTDNDRTVIYLLITLNVILAWIYFVFM